MSGLLTRDEASYRRRHASLQAVQRCIALMDVCGCDTRYVVYLEDGRTDESSPAHVTWMRLETVEAFAGLVMLTHVCMLRSVRRIGVQDTVREALTHKMSHRLCKRTSSVGAVLSFRTNDDSRVAVHSRVRSHDMVFVGECFTQCVRMCICIPNTEIRRQRQHTLRSFQRHR